MTWPEIVRIEPRLQELLNDVQAIKDDGGNYFCANEHWVLTFKPRLCKLVGFDAAREELQTSKAYDVAYMTLYDPLPPCRNCGCL